MYPIGRLYSWCRNNTAGPQFAALVKHDGSLVDLDYRSGETPFTLRDTDPNEIVGVVTLLPADNKWHGEYTIELDYPEYAPARGPARHGYVTPIEGSGESKEDAANQLLEEKAERQMQQQVVLDDPALHLEETLKSRDWYAAFSDDHRYFVAGEGQRNLTNTLIALVDPETVRKLWAEHAPEDVQCPLLPLARVRITQDNEGGGGDEELVGATGVVTEIEDGYAEVKLDERGEDTFQFGLYQLEAE